MPDWQEILTRDGPAAWQTAYRLLGNRADADECFQDACLAAVEFSRREHVLNWRGVLQSLAVARAVDRLRSRRRAKFVTDPSGWCQLEGSEPSPAQSAEEAELASELRAALSKIPPRQAEVFCLHCIEDWSYQEIAGHLSVSIDSVGVLLHRARQRLCSLLGRFGPSRPATGQKEPPIPQDRHEPAGLRKEDS
jgi:RNA polymerase sigma-70 factor (ECF subfamily)